MSKTLITITRWFPALVRFLASSDGFQQPAPRPRQTRARRSLNG